MGLILRATQSAGAPRSTVIILAREAFERLGVLADDCVVRLRGHLTRIYGESVASETVPRLVSMLEDFIRANPECSVPPTQLFDETDVMLISYGDQVREPGRAPLEALRDFLATHVGDVVSGVHLLPHHPSSSDDGFAVVDFATVDPGLGEWRHVEELASGFRLMLDAVVNHTSASHPWFLRWLCDDRRYADYYLALPPDIDLASVTRPRTTPLLTPTPGAVEDRRWVWTTFSADQVDLNYANPEVLLAVTEVLLGYVARGARLLRLDAVAFLWKRVGTSCLHLPETHEIVRLWRTVMEAVAPGTLLVTETNVPHRENVSYLGSGADEAHLVYQFALPPLTLDAFHAGDATRLTEWATTVRAPSEETSFLNFLGSHDGIGLRPVEGLLSEDDTERLAAAVLAHGGGVSYRATADGGQRPYELNSVYLDALGPVAGDEPQPVQVARFLAAHSVLLALAGVPLLYFHSLFGSRNWTEGADHTGRARVVNRQRLARGALEAQLADPGSLRRQVLDQLRARIRVRTGEPAFHPNAAQACVAGGPSYFAVQRTARSGDSTVLCVHDVSGRPGRFRATPPEPLGGGTPLVDLCDGSRHVVEADGTVDVDVPAYGVRWLRAL
jgi:glycosidase